MAKSYSATSLEDIAKFFDQRAEFASREAARATAKKHEDLYRREEGVWSTAAAILRDTHLSTDPNLPT